MRVLCLLSLLLLFGGAAARAQDARPLVEPTFPPVCKTIAAPLTADATGPLAGDSGEEEDAESARQTRLVQRALNGCRAGQAVELTLGRTPAHNAFLIEPITVPDGVSLIVDGGVTVFASRNPANFQKRNGHGWICGEVGQEWPVFGACQPLVTLRSKSGVYGYGVLDGQGQRNLIRDGKITSKAWWDLLVKKNKGCKKSQDGEEKTGEKTNEKNGCEQAAPPMIHTGAPAGNELRTDLTLYKITIRNPPFHTVMLAGAGVTIWGVKVQAPWNVPNSDGFDLRGTDILVKDVTVANGDQDVVLTSTKVDFTRRVTVDDATIYSKGGVALLGDGIGITDVLVNDVAMTGGVTSFERKGGSGEDGTVLINGRDPLKMHLRGGEGAHLTSYGQALPTATDEVQGIQLNYNLQKTQEPPGPKFANIEFRSVCMQDVVWPLAIWRLNKFSQHPPGDTTPALSNVLFRDIHVLPPSEQYPRMKLGVAREQFSGTYHARFDANPPAHFFNHFTLRNVVFDDLETGERSLTDVAAKGNVLRTLDNVYPPVLNSLDGGPPDPPPGWVLRHNRYVRKTAVSDAALAIPCPAQRWSFLTGELYLSRSGSQPSDRATNLQAISVPVGSSVTLNAVVQPAMSQSTWFVPESYHATPGLLAIGAPALTEPVEFYEGRTLVGTGSLGANGTLATATIRKIGLGLHTYTAKYPGDAYYRPFLFGDVRVTAR